MKIISSSNREYLPKTLARNAGIYGRELTNPDSEDIRDQFMTFVTQLLDDVDSR